MKAAFPEPADLLRRIATATIETLAVVVPREALKIAPLAGIIARDDDFFSMVSRDTVQDSSYRGFTFHFKPGRLDETAKLNRVGEVLGISMKQLHDVVSVINQLPALAVGHEALIAELDQRLAGKPLALTGNYFTGVSLEDCVCRSQKEFLRLQKEQLIHP
jgi:oxygen-dependent protoporphyrinogen oxidase